MTWFSIYWRINLLEEGLEPAHVSGTCGKPLGNKITVAQVLMPL